MTTASGTQTGQTEHAATTATRLTPQAAGEGGAHYGEDTGQ
jgi:hypothetical protein